MKTKRVLINEQSVYNHIKKEWQISTDLNRLKRVPLQKLGVSTLEVNWLLDTMEGEYHCNITEETVSLGMPLEDFVQHIMQSNRK